MEVLYIGLLLIGVFISLFIPTWIMFSFYYVIAFIRIVHNKRNDSNIKELLLKDVHHEVMLDDDVYKCRYVADNFGDPNLLLDFGSPYVMPIVCWIMMVIEILVFIWRIIRRPVLWVFGCVVGVGLLIGLWVDKLVVSPVKKGYKWLEDKIGNINLK